MAEHQHGDRHGSGVPAEGRVSRRRLLQTGLAAATAGTLGVVPGWAMSAAQSGVAMLGAAQPRRGGQLRVAHVGNGVAETVDPNAVVAIIDNARAVNLFN